MKSLIRTFLFLVTANLPFNIFGQCPNSDLVITFDALAAATNMSNSITTSTGGWTVKAGRNVWVNVVNTNPYMFDVEIKVDKQYFQQQVPSLPANILTVITGLKDLPSVGTAGVFNIPVLADLKAAAKEIPNIPKSYDLVEGPKKKSDELDADTIIDSYYQILNTVDTLNIEYLKVINAIFYTNSCYDTAGIDKCYWYSTSSDLMGDINYLKEKCIKYLARHKEDKSHFKEVVVGILKGIEDGHIKKTFSTMANQIAELRMAKKIWDRYQVLLREVSTINVHLLELKQIDLSNSVPVWLNRPNSIKIANYNAQLNSLDSLNILCTQYIHQHQGANAAYLKVVEAIKQNIDGGALNEIFSDYYQFVMNYGTNVFTFSSIPIEAEGDEINITINITPKDSIHHPILRTTHVEHTIDVCGYWQANFSSGFFINTLTDKQFAQLFDDGAGAYHLLSEGNNKVDIGINALTHLVYKIQPSFGIGGHIGAGMSLKSNPSIQILGGISMSFGKNNRFVLNAGGAVGRRDVLLDNLNITDIYATKLETITKKQTGIGWQFSLTYDFLVSK